MKKAWHFRPLLFKSKKIFQRFFAEPRSFLINSLIRFDKPFLLNFKVGEEIVANLVGKRC